MKMLVTSVARAGRHCVVPLALTLAACGGTADAPPAAGDAASAAVHPAFEELAAASGLDFRHDSGATGKFYFPEIMGPGVALFDYDADGDLDVFAVQGGPLETGGNAREHTGHRLYRNELVPEGALRFVDVSAASGIDDRGYGMGVAIGDVDNDGDPDLYLTKYGANVLYLNEGDGRFSNVGAQSGTDDDAFGSSAAMFDYDQDGLLDLFVANYNTFNVDNHRSCRGAGGSSDYCDPLTYEPAVDRFYRNLGDGRFEDVGATTGIDQHFGTGLGVISADFDLDGAPDIYVANDKMANIYWINDGTGRFSNESLMSGAAYNADGVAEASMGVVAGDVDGDGDDDLFMTHLTAQTNTLYLNDGSGSFRDATDRLNLGASSLSYTGFGTVWIDYDNDGDHDLLIANGAVARQGQASGDRLAEYGQRNQLYRNDGSGRFEHVSDAAGDAFRSAFIGRGSAVGDIDNDGDLDVVVSNTDGPLELLINRTDTSHHWLAVRLRGVTSNHDGVGAKVALVRPSGATLWRRAHTDGSYLSASDIRVHFGLGDDTAVAGVGVVWPTGERELFTDLSVDALNELREGSGQPWNEDSGNVDQGLRP